MGLPGKAQTVGFRTRMADSRSTIDRQREAYRLLLDAHRADALNYDRLPPGTRDKVDGWSRLKRGPAPKAPSPK